MNQLLKLKQTVQLDNDTAVAQGQSVALSTGITLNFWQAQVPVLVLISDGQPTDDFTNGLNDLMALPWGKKAIRVGIAIGDDANLEVLDPFMGNPELPSLQAHNAEQLVNYSSLPTPSPLSP